VVCAARSQPPFDVGAVVLEDDTYCVLSADPEVREPDEHPIRLWNALHELEPAQPGSLIVRAGTPPIWLAIIHDLSQDPTWSETWVVAALATVLAKVERGQIARLGLQPLGGVHGKLGPDRFATLLGRALDDSRPRSLERLWLLPPAGTERAWERAFTDPG
jgi:hypothetical protein